MLQSAINGFRVYGLRNENFKHTCTKVLHFDKSIFALIKVFLVIRMLPIGQISSLINFQQFF